VRFYLRLVVRTRLTTASVAGPFAGGRPRFISALPALFTSAPVVIRAMTTTTGTSLGFGIALAFLGPTD
jgi:hypothetical protein